MKRTALALVTLGLALAACSKPAPAENSSNDSVAASSENLSDVTALDNAADTNGSNASNGAL